MKTIRYLASAFAVALLAVLFTAAAGAQENATISGIVTDSTGAAVPNASVTVTHLATHISRTSRSDGAGLYTFTGLQIGNYSLTVKAPGFKTYEKSGLVLNEAQVLRADATLQVGAETQTVTVQANALQTQTETNEVSTLITGQQILQLSTNGRNAISLATLGTGVANMTPAFNGVTAQGSSATISFNGMRDAHNNWMIDGGEVYDRGSGGKLDVNPSPDALAEFQVLASNYTPKYGIASGGTIAMVLKSGTNRFHGGVWEFNRNDDFDAANYFSKQSHTATPELRLNIFGGNIGGPIFKNKTFFFVNEEWRRLIQGANPSLTNTVPLQNIPTAAGQDLNYLVYQTTNPSSGVYVPLVPINPTTGAPFANNCPATSSTKVVSCTATIPGSMIDSNAVLFMGTGAIPKPDVVNAGAGQYQWIASPAQPTNVREDVVRIDHHFNQKYQLMGHWIHDQMLNTQYPSMWSNDSYDTVGTQFQNPSWGSVIKLTQTLSPSLLNETALDVNGNTINMSPVGIYKQPSGWSAVGIFSGNDPQNRLPSVDLQNSAPSTNWTTNYWPWRNAYLNYQIRDDISWTHGQHVFTFGVSYMRSDKNQQVQADTQGDFTFNASAFSKDAYINFLLGDASSYSQLQSQWIAHWINNTYSFYANDNWHALPRLTLNLGLRYDALPHVYEKNNRTANFIPGDFSAADEQYPGSNGLMNPNGPGFVQPAGAATAYYLNGIQLAGVGGFPRGLVKNFYGTVEPRVGFAYDLSGNGKTVIRGGAGIFYERVQGNDIYGTDTNPPWAFQPNVSNVQFSNPNLAVGQTTPNTGAFQPGPSGPSSLAYNYYSPGEAQFSLGVQHEIAPSVVSTIQYVGSAGWHQNDQRAINTLPLSDIADRELVGTGANANLYRIFGGFSGITMDENETNQSYNSLQAAVRMEHKHGLTLELAYTWSHEIDIQSDDLAGTLSDPFNVEYDRGSGSSDQRNIFNVNYIYDLPFFLHSSNGFVRSTLGGWQLSGITAANSGSPRNITYNGTDTVGLGGGTSVRPNVSGRMSYPKKQKEWFDTSLFSDPIAAWDTGATNQGFGSAHKDAVVGPGLFNWNMSLFKEFSLTSREAGPRIQLRAESYNTFNHTEFNGIDTGSHDGNFGQVTSANDPRVFQFGGKFMF